MELLHICSYYIGNKLYTNLVEELSNGNISQNIYIPVKNRNKIGINQLEGQYENVRYLYSNILKIYDKFFYFTKIKKQLNDIQKFILPRVNLDMVHAHTLFSDGGTAYLLKKKYDLNYVVNIRNTDINVFFKYGLHLRPFIYKVLLNAEAIIFVSPAYKELTFSILPTNIQSQVANKCKVIPNGIDAFWHENILNTDKKVSEFNKGIRLIFIGELNRNKNLNQVIQACNILNRRGYKVSLDVIGDGPLKKEYETITKRLNMDKQIFFHGFIKDRQCILRIMDSCDIFVMTSIRETFGLVYIEAMSRGIPAIYTKGQGIDGFYKEGEVGYSADPHNVEMLSNTILKVIENYDEISRNCLRIQKDFRWEAIANKLKKIYIN